jgi:hypothetical protein
MLSKKWPENSGYVEVIGPSGAVRVLVATRPVDFRNGAEGLAALVTGRDEGQPIFRRCLCIPRQTGGPDQAAFLGWDRRVPVRQAARGRQVQLAEHRRRREAIRYALSRWEGLTRFLEDGRIEIDSNMVERSIRPIALNRKNALFAGSDGGGENWAIIATLIENCKLSGVDPGAYLADVLTKIVNGHPNSAIDDLLPWAYASSQQFKEVA